MAGGHRLDQNFCAVAFDPQILERASVSFHLHDFFRHLHVRFLRRYLRHHLPDVGHLLPDAAQFRLWQAGKDQRLSPDRRGLCLHHGHDHQALEPLVSLRYQRYDQGNGYGF